MYQMYLQTSVIHPHANPECNPHNNIVCLFLNTLEKQSLSKLQLQLLFKKGATLR